MATRELLYPTKYGLGDFGDSSDAFDGWKPYKSGDYIDTTRQYGSITISHAINFLFDRISPTVKVRRVTVSFSVRNLPVNKSIVVQVYADNLAETPYESKHFLGSKSVTNTSTSELFSVTIDASSENHFYASSQLTVRISPTSACDVRLFSISAYYAPITIDVTPNPVNAGQPADIHFENRLDEELEVTFKKSGGTQAFDTITVNSNDIEYTCPESWFDGFSESTYSINIYVSATSDRAVTFTTFKLARPKPNTVTILSPTSGTFDVSEEIPFSWTSTGDGTQTKAKLEWSTDESTWTVFGEVDGAEEEYTAKRGTFRYNGKIYWRVSVYNSLDTWSSPAQASISITLKPATVTLTSPTSGSWSGSDAITFGWSINPGSGTQTNITGVQLQVSTDDGLNWNTILNVVTPATRYEAKAAQFPAGKLRWRVRAKNYWQGDYAENWAAASITITYSAVSQIKTVNSPTSGRVPASVDQTYAVALTPSAPVYTPFTIQSATMYWRAGTSGEYTAVPMTASGANASVTIPGGTFPSGTIQWYAEAVDNTGATRTTDVYTLLALNASVEAVPLSPINTIEGTSSEITFTWLYYSLDGTAQSRALLEYSRDGESWDTIADVPGSDTTYTAPAGFFTSAGVVYWRVQAFNASGTAGPKSEPVSFTLFGSSSVTSVIGDGKPFATVKWQAEGQVSYELMIGDKHIGPYFGVDVRSYTLAEPLEDGVYTIKVRIQNKYGIWSEWAEAEMSVQNQPSSFYVNIFAKAGNTIVLNINGKIVNIITQQPRDIQTTDPQLAKISCTFTKQWGTCRYNVQELLQGSVSWKNVGFGYGDNDDTEYTAEYLIENPSQHNGSLFRFVIGDFETTSRTAKFTYAEPYKQAPDITGRFWPETGYFLIYRDDKLIAKTHENVFEDRSALGTHRYSAVQALPQGFYLRSNVVTVSAFVKSPLIAPLAGGDFIELRLSTEADRAQDFQRSREVARMRYSGTRWPVSEVGEAETLSVTFDAAWKQTDKAAADAFEALVGEDVILKTPGGKSIVGTLEGCELHDPRFYKSYRCTLQQGDWRDFTNADA